MVTEDYVSFEVAKLLKEKGFQQLQDNCGYFTTEMIYSINANDNGEHHFAHQYPAGVYNKDKYIAAPTLQMAMKWLRETHNIGIFPSLFAFCVGEGGAAKPTYGTKIISLKSCELLTDDTNPMPTYEQACEAAIRYTLENLI